MPHAPGKFHENLDRGAEFGRLSYLTADNKRGCHEQRPQIRKTMIYLRDKEGDCEVDSHILRDGREDGAGQGKGVHD